MQKLYPHEVLKAALTEGFKQLKKAGYVTRQNHTCCQSCGWAAIPEAKSDKVVFYHRQDADGLYEGRVHLAWAGNGTEICRVFRQLGLVTDWDGSEGTRVELILLPGREEFVNDRVNDAIAARMSAKALAARV